MARSAPRYIARWLLLAGTGALSAGAALGWHHRAGAAAARYPVWGIDVSHHQHNIDWTQVGTSGATFAYIKSTEGGDWVDPNFAHNRAQAKAAGVLVGAYHFFTFCTPGRDQAMNFLREAAPLPGELPPVVDVEFAGNCRGWSSIDAIQHELAVFVDRVSAATGAPPVLYVTPLSALRVTGASAGGGPLWIRNTLWQPWLPPLGDWQLWQHSDRSSVPGIEGPVDRNVWRGDRAQLAAFAR